MDTTYSVATLKDCQDVVSRYSIDQVSFGKGTVEGFTAHLFRHGKAITGVWDLANRVTNYVALVNETEVDEKEILDYAAGVHGALEQNVRYRAELASYIQSVKAQGSAGAIWACIAEMATTPEGVKLNLCAAHGLDAELVGNVIRGLRAFQRHLQESVLIHYTPGDDPVLDKLLRSDIVRFDQSLSDAPPVGWIRRRRVVRSQCTLGARASAPG
jgi:hypothetical protein